jgi:hypothetical protein
MASARINAIDTTAIIVVTARESAGHVKFRQPTVVMIAGDFRPKHYIRLSAKAHVRVLFSICKTLPQRLYRALLPTECNLQTKSR